MIFETPQTPYPGIHWIKLPLAESPLKYVSVYLLPAKNGHLLIDTGWNTDDTFDALMHALHALGITATDIGHVLITHAHIDHYGLAARLMTLCGAQLSMHALEKDTVALRYVNTPKYLLQANALLESDGAGPALHADVRQSAERFARLTGQAPRPDTLLHGGETLRHGHFEFEVLWTPGHSPGHICLYEPYHRILFSGDHVLPGIAPNIGIFPLSGPNPLGDYIRSLKRIRSMDVGLTLPGHGPLLTGLARRVDQTLAHHDRRNAEMVAIMSANRLPLTAYALARNMQWYSKRKRVAWQELQVFDQRLTVSDVSARLAFLTEEGELTRHTTAGVHTYAPK